MQRGLYEKKPPVIFINTGRIPGSENNSEGKFRAAWMVTVLQRDLGVHYPQELIAMDDRSFLSRSDHLFIHGIIQGKGGTCSSLPLLYAAVGRRLGYPLKLVHCKKHVFLRWDSEVEPFNIECTSRGFVSQLDEYYLTGAFATTPDEATRYAFLRPRTQAEEIAGQLSRRGNVWMAYQRYGDATFEHLHAFHKAPGLQEVLDDLHVAVTHWGKQLRSQIGQGFPSLTICNQPRRHQELPLNLQGEINYLNALETMLNDPIRKVTWWDPLRRNPAVRPVGMPERIRVTYPSETGQPLKFEPCEPDLAAYVAQSILVSAQ